MLAIKKEEHA
jgi:hypothetical protein